MTEFNFDTSYYFSSLDNLNKECKNYTNSEARYQELRLKYENEIYNKALEDYMNKALEMLKIEQDTRYGYLDGMDIREIAEQLKKGIEE